MPKSRSRSHSRKSRRQSRSGSRKSRRMQSRSRSGSRKSRRLQSRSRSRSGSHRAGVVYVPRGISQGRAKRLVYDGVYRKTRGGLIKSDLTENKYGKVVSIRKMKAGKALQRANPFKKNKEFMKYAGKVENL